MLQTKRTSHYSLPGCLTIIFLRFTTNFSLSSSSLSADKNHFNIQTTQIDLFFAVHLTKIQLYNMQVFQWLFKVKHDQQQQQARDKKNNTTSYEEDIDSEPRDIILYKHGGGGVYYKRVKGRSGSKLGHKYLKFICRKDVAKACFYNTLNLRRLGSIKRRQHWTWIQSMKIMKKEEDNNSARNQGANHSSSAAATTGHSGSKVLPINDITAALENSDQRQRGGDGSVEKKDNKDHKTRTISRMKELLRWAAAAKSEKGGKFIGRKVLHFRNRGNLKTVAADDDFNSIESPKISFRWDMESCSTTTSVYSAISMASSSKMINDHTRKLNWITTDSDFVVLEL